MNRICLVPLIGLPAVGKTTVSQHIMQMDSLPFNFVHVCYDEFISFNPVNPTHYKEQREVLVKSLKTIVQTLKTSKNFSTELLPMKIHYKPINNSNHIVIICDDNHYYRSMRYKLFQLAREHSIGYCQIYFEHSIKLALERNNLRGASTHVPEDVIVEMFERFETPNSRDYKWEENTLVLQNSDLYEYNCKEIISYMEQFIGKFVEPLHINVSKLATPQSKVHELDLLIRKRIKLLLSLKQERDKHLLAKNLNNKRKEILEEFKVIIGKEFQRDLNLNKYVELLN